MSHFTIEGTELADLLAEAQRGEPDGFLLKELIPVFRAAGRPFGLCALRKVLDDLLKDGIIRVVRVRRERCDGIMMSTTGYAFND